MRRALPRSLFVALLISGCWRAGFERALPVDGAVRDASADARVDSGRDAGEEEDDDAGACELPELPAAYEPRCASCHGEDAEGLAELEISLEAFVAEVRNGGEDHRFSREQIGDEALDRLYERLYEACR